MEAPLTLMANWCESMLWEVLRVCWEHLCGKTMGKMLDFHGKYLSAEKMFWNLLVLDVAHCPALS